MFWNVITVAKAAIIKTDGSRFYLQDYNSSMFINYLNLWKNMQDTLNYKVEEHL